jgi:thiol-disulfide isomerase/thioredoxin
VKVSTIALVCLGALLSAPSFAQAHFDLKGLRGHVVYVDFWASWCTPCRQSFPWMKALESTYGAQGLSVVAIDLDHDRTSQWSSIQPERWRNGSTSWECRPV